MLNILKLATVLSHWSTLLNFIIQNSFNDGIAICIFQHQKFEFDISIDKGAAAKNFQYINIWSETLNESYAENVFDFQRREQIFQAKELSYDQLILKLTAAIELNHCEAFIAFQADIPIFSSAFRTACKYSEWRSQRTQFLFAFSRDLMDSGDENYFDDLLFIDQPRILVIEAAALDAVEFELKTTKFVGSLRDKPEQLLSINKYDAKKKAFEKKAQPFYPNKMENFYGREVAIGGFDYRPFVALDYEKLPQNRDRAPDNPQGTVHIDGAESRLLITFCELHNCTVEADTSEKTDWGDTFDNGTGSGLMGMVIDRKIDMALDAFYHWIVQNVDRTTFLGRSGVTCLVPKPVRVTSWYLPLRPFQAMLWLGVCVCLVLEVLALLVTYHAEILLVLAELDRNWARSTHFGCMTTLKIFLSQSPDIEVVSVSVRTVLFSCFMIDIIITSVYGGGLASILTLPTLAEAPDSVERLHRFDIPWIATSPDWIFGLLDATEPRIVDLVRNYHVYDLDEMTAFAKTENMGFVLERMAFGHFGNVDFLTPQALDRLKLMVDDIFYQYTTGLVPRLWPYLAKFNMFTYNWHSSGMGQYWEWKVSADFMNENEQKQIQASMAGIVDAGPVKLDMSNFAGLIVIWILGIISSILAFGLEYAHFTYKQRKRQRAN